MILTLLEYNLALSTTTSSLTLVVHVYVHAPIEVDNHQGVLHHAPLQDYKDNHQVGQATPTTSLYNLKIDATKHEKPFQQFPTCHIHPHLHFGAIQMFISLDVAKTLLKSPYHGKQVRWLLSNGGRISPRSLLWPRLAHVLLAQDNQAPRRWHLRMAHEPGLKKCIRGQLCDCSKASEPSLKAPKILLTTKLASMLLGPTANPNQCTRETIAQYIGHTSRFDLMQGGKGPNQKLPIALHRALPPQAVPRQCQQNMNP